jgi:hypothetical protein
MLNYEKIDDSWLNHAKLLESNGIFLVGVVEVEKLKRHKGYL